MIAVDTNILVRLITRDDTAKAEVADHVMSQPVLVTLTVLLELAWVLSGRTYRFHRAALSSTLHDLLDMSTVTVPSEDRVRWAIDRYAAGADFADMIHIVAARDASSFVSFEDRLSTRAGAATPVPVRRP